VAGTLPISTQRFLTLHGNRVAYREQGDPNGEPLLLVHGMAGSSLVWEGVMRELSREYRVIAPDFLGHGESDKPRTDYSLGAFAVFLRDFLDALGIPSATLVGHSLGGGVALQFAHQHRQHCRRLVLVNSGGLGADVGMPLRLLSAPGAELVLPVIASRPAMALGNGIKFLQNARGSDTERLQDRVKKYTALNDPAGRNAFLRTLRSVVDVRGQTVSALNRLAELGADLPTLIIAGDEDKVIPSAHALAAHAALPGSRLEILRGAGHHPQFECPGELARLIDGFMSAHSGRVELTGVPA
jgi:pimeloyl-ACP methyl ester carboxylesterase